MGLQSFGPHSALAIAAWGQGAWSVLLQGPGQMPGLTWGWRGGMGGWVWHRLRRCDVIFSGGGGGRDPEGLLAGPVALSPHSRWVALSICRARGRCGVEGASHLGSGSTERKCQALSASMGRTEPAATEPARRSPTPSAPREGFRGGLRREPWGCGVAGAQPCPAHPLGVLLPGGNGAPSCPLCSIAGQARLGGGGSHSPSSGGTGQSWPKS